MHEFDLFTCHFILKLLLFSKYSNTLLHNISNVVNNLSCGFYICLNLLSLLIVITIILANVGFHVLDYMLGSKTCNFWNVRVSRALRVWEDYFGFG